MGENHNDIDRKDRAYFAKFRKLLPAADQYTYLNSAGCGPLALPVLRRMTEIFTRMAEEGQVNVEVHDWLKEMLEEVRRDVAGFIHAEPEEIFFVRCIAEGLNTINRMFDWTPGEQILISDQENPASILPCFVLEPEYQIETEKFCGLGNQEQILGQFRNRLNTRTKMAVFSHVFHTTGAAVPAKDMCREARKRGVTTVLDGAQAAGNIAIDVKEIGCDFYLLSCHKWLCGPEGIAAVYIRKELLDQVKVPFGGVGMQESFAFDTNSLVPQPDARRFEYGGRHTPMYAAFTETINLAKNIGLSNMIERRRELYWYCRDAFIREIPEAILLSPEDERLITGIFSFVIPGKDHQTLVKQAWEQEKIIIQWRTMDLYTKEEGIRVSLNWFVTEDEIDRLVAFVKRAVG